MLKCGGISFGYNPVVSSDSYIFMSIHGEQTNSIVLTERKGGIGTQTAIVDVHLNRTMN